MNGANSLDQTNNLNNANSSNNTNNIDNTNHSNNLNYENNINGPNNANNVNQRKKIIMFLISLFLFVIIIFIGTACYKFLFDIPWIDGLYAAIVNATSIDISVTAVTFSQKIFIIIYSTISILIFISLIIYGLQQLFDIVEQKL
jgi:hypothetical protein